MPLVLLSTWRTVTPDAKATRQHGVHRRLQTQAALVHQLQDHDGVKVLVMLPIRKRSSGSSVVPTVSADPAAQ